MYLFQPFNACGVTVVTQTEIHTAEPLVPEPSSSEELAIKKRDSHKSAGTDQIPVELVKAGG